MELDEQPIQEWKNKNAEALDSTMEKSLGSEREEGLV